MDVLSALTVSSGCLFANSLAFKRIDAK